MLFFGSTCDCLQHGDTESTLLPNSEITIVELRVQIYELQIQIHELRVQINKLATLQELKKHELQD